MSKTGLSATTVVYLLTVPRRFFGCSSLFVRRWFPGVSLILLFVALWFILRGDLFCVLPCLILFLCFAVLLALRLPRLGKRELIFVLFVRLLCLGRAAVCDCGIPGLFSYPFCDCGTPWTFVLPFLSYVAFVLALFVPHLSFFWCLRKTVLRDCDIARIFTLIVLLQNSSHLGALRSFKNNSQ